MHLLRFRSCFVAVPFILCFIATSPGFFVGGQRGNFYTTQEKAAIAKLRSLVGDKLTLDYQKKDGYLLRWIRSYEFDMAKAQKYLEKTLKWRKEHNMDNILEGDTGASKRDLPYNMDGVDRGGRPLLVMGFGKWQLRKYIVAGKREEASKEFKRLVEKVVRKVFETADKTGKDIDQFYYLVEFQGYNRRENLCVACVPLTLDFAASFDSSSSPFIRNLTLINVPRYFQPVLTLVKEVFGFLALKSLHDFDSNKLEWQPAILKDIAPNQLPKSISGPGGL